MFLNHWKPFQRNTFPATFRYLFNYSNKQRVSSYNKAFKEYTAAAPLYSYNFPKHSHNRSVSQIGIKCTRTSPLQVHVHLCNLNLRPSALPRHVRGGFRPFMNQFAFSARKSHFQFGRKRFLLKRRKGRKISA